MNSRKNRFISGLLAFVMALTMVSEVIPPVYAAAPSSTFPNKTETMYLGDEYEFTKKATANDSNIVKVLAAIYTPASKSSEDTGYSTDRGGYWYENDDLNKTSFSYGSYIDSFTWGEVYESLGGQTIDTSKPGKYYVTVWTKAADGGTTRRTHTINLKLRTPEVTSHDFGEYISDSEDVTMKWGRVDYADYYLVNVLITKDGDRSYLYENEEYSASKRQVTIDSDELRGAESLEIEITAYTEDDYPSQTCTCTLLIEETEDSTDPEISDITSDLGDTFAEQEYPEFTIEISDDVELDKIKIYLDGDLMETESLSDTYASITYRTSTLSTSDKEMYFASGSHTFKVKAYDTAGNTTTTTYDYTVVSKPIITATLPNQVTIGDIITISGTITSSDSPIKVVSIEVNNPAGTLGYYPFRNASVGASSFSLSSISTKSSDGTVTAGGIETGCVSSGYVGTSYTYYGEAFDFTEPGTYLIAIRAQNEFGIISEYKCEVELVEPISTGILGDVNSDGNVNDIDQFIFKRYLDNIEGYTVDTTAADINGNGKVTSDDLIILNNYLVTNNGYENLYDFYNQSGSSYKPTISGVSQIYYVEKGDELTIPFTLTAQNNGKIEKVTMKHNLVGTSFQAQSYECNVNSYSNSFSISGYPLNEVGTHTFVIYCRASNHTVTSNEITIFTVYVTDKECSHENFDHQYQRTVYTETHKTLVEHTYYHEYLSVCEDCGYEICTVTGEGVTEGHKLTSKGYCLCGYIDTSGYAIWEGYNSSGKNVTVYSNPEATSQYGLIYANESVTVLGECCGRYLIEYDLDSGGTKQGYVAKNNISEYVTNTTSAKYSLAIDDKYFFEENSRKIWFIEQYGYSKVHIIDNNTGSKIAYSENDLLEWSLKYNNNDSIDKYGTLCMRSAPGEINILELYYDGELIDSIECWVVNDKTRITTMDCVEDWNSKLLFINDYCIITDYTSVYNAANDTYTVTMKVYNKSPVAFGIGSMAGNTSGWSDFQYINTDWDDFSLVDKSVETFEMFAGAFTASDPLNYIAYLEDAEETNIELTVPAGGRIIFAGPADDPDVFIANIAELVIAILATSDDFVALLGKPIKASNIRNMISNATFFNKIKAALINMGLDELIKSAISNKDTIHVMRDIISIISDPNNKDDLKQLMLTVAECSSSARKDIAVDVAKKIELLCWEATPAYLIVQGSDTVLSCLETINIISSNVNIIKNEKTFNEIGFWVQYPNE